MELIYTDEDFNWNGSIERYSMDIAFGEDENNFELKINKIDAVDEYGNLLFDLGCLVFVPETEYGGIIDEISVDASGYDTELTFTGRSWHGIMEHAIIQPNYGKDYYEVSGDCNTVIKSLIERHRLTSIFEVSSVPCGVGVSYRFNRYTDLYKGIRKMLGTVGMKLKMSRKASKTKIEAVQALSYSNGSTELMQSGKANHAEFIGYEMKKCGNVVNHLVCLGEGELKDRTVINLYADENGNVGRTQYLFGVNEVAEVYDYSNADYDTLLEEGTKKLEGYQSFSEASINISESYDLTVGDSIEAHSEELGLSAYAEVTKIIVKLEFDEEPNIEYSVGVEDYEEGIL